MQMGQTLLNTPAQPRYAHFHLRKLSDITQVHAGRYASDVEILIAVSNDTGVERDQNPATGRDHQIPPSETTSSVIKILQLVETTCNPDMLAIHGHTAPEVCADSIRARFRMAIIVDAASDVCAAFILVVRACSMSQTPAPESTDSQRPRLHC
eukprot:gene679-368_t